MRQVRNIPGLIALTLLAAGAHTTTLAAPIVFGFETEFSGSGDTCANVTCGTLSVEQVGTGVEFILTANLATGEYIEGLYGNLDPFPSLFPSVSGGSITGDSTAAFTQSQDAYKADGDGFFDWLWSFTNANTVRFENSDVLTWTFDNTSIDDIVDAVSVNGPEGKNGFTFALRVRGLGEDNEGSGWFYDDGGSGEEADVPEPGVLFLMGAGLLGLGMARRRKAA